MKETTDIWFAAFLLNIKKLDVTAIARKDRGRAIFCFNISKDVWFEAKKEFNEDTNIYSTIKYQLERLKDLIH